MIHDIFWRQEVRQDIEQRLAFAHRDLTAVVSALRDTGAQVWTETPSDSAVVTPPVFSLAGWRVHFGQERARLNGFNSRRGTALANYDPPLAEALVGYLTSTVTLGAAFDTALNAPTYRDASGNLIQRQVTQAHRNALADAIEAELE